MKTNWSPPSLSTPSCLLRMSQLPMPTTQFLMSQGSDPGSQSSKQRNFPPKSFQHASLRKQIHTGWPSPEKQQTSVNRINSKLFVLCLLTKKKKNQKWFCVHPVNGFWTQRRDSKKSGHWPFVGGRRSARIQNSHYLAMGSGLLAPEQQVETGW